MTKPAHPNTYRGRAEEVLATARATMSTNLNQDLIEKVAVLQEYLDLTTRYPRHDYGAVIRRASTELNAVIRGTSTEYRTEQRLLFPG